MNSYRNQDPLYAGPRQRPYEGRNELNPMSPGLRPGAQQAEIMESNQARAARYEDEKKRIINSCFSSKEADGVLVESYITHVKVTEDAMFPSGPPPPDSAPGNKKNRVILVAVRKSGRVRVHKARENPSGTFSIGKTWPLDDLSSIHIYTGVMPRNNREELEQQWASDVGFVVTLGKPYYWQAPTAKEKDFFIASLIKIYRKYTGGKLPALTGFLPHQLEQLTGGQPIRQISPPVVQGISSPVSAMSMSPAPLSATSGRQAQSPFNARPSELEAHQSSYASNSQVGNNEQHPVPRDDLGSAVPEPVRSPLRTDRRMPSRDNMRGQKTPEGSASSFHQSPGPIDRFQSGAPKALSPSPQSSQSSLQRPERPYMNAARPTNGVSTSRTPADYSHSNLNVPVYAADKSETSTITSERPTTSTTESTTNDSRPTTSQDSLPDRRRPMLDRPELPRSQKSAASSETNSRFATPAATPSVPRAELSKTASPPQDQPIDTNTSSPPKKDYFGGFGKQSAPQAEILSPPPNKIDAGIEPQASSQASPLSITDQAVSAEPESVSSEQTEVNKTEEEHRPGLGPMIKKKTGKDVADKFRKAAFAANAFKPREGGAAARLKALQDKDNKSGEPDGITGVVPAPLLRGMSSDNAQTDQPSTPVIDKTPVSDTIMNNVPPKVQIQRSATEDSIKTPDPQPQAQALAVKAPSKEAQEVRMKHQRDPSPEKARSRSPQRRKRQRQEADIERYCSSLGVDPRIFEGRGADFNDLLTEFGWDGRVTDRAKIDEFEAGIRQEIGRAQATGWLGHVEQQEGKIHELAKAFDKAIEECEELDGLFTLYSHELDTLAADIEYIEAQSQGLQVQTANQKLLHNELQSLLTTLSIPSTDLRDLRHSTIDDSRGVATVERALSLLYKALLTIDPDIRQNKLRQGAGSSNERSGVGVYADTEIGQMRAVRQKKDEYREETQVFIRRFNQHMTAIFKRIEQRHSEESSRTAASASNSTLELPSQLGSRQELWMYNALMLFVREVNSYEWQTLIASYEMNAKGIYQEQFRNSAMSFRRGVHKPGTDDQDYLFTTQEKEKSDDSLAHTAARKLTVKRGKTVKTSAVKSSGGERRDGKPDAWEVFQSTLQIQAKTISEEQNFIVSFFHLNSQAPADFAEIIASRPPEERRLPNLNAKQSYDPDRTMAKIVQGVIEGIYSFWLGDLQHLLEWVLSIDQLQGIGVLYAMEQSLALYEETNQEYITRTIRAVHDRLVGLFHKFVDEQVRAIEETKVKLKKRKGIISFMRTFPAFSTTVENMMSVDAANADTLEIRFIVNEAYTKILKAMWESLNFIAKDDPASGGATVHSAAPAGGDPEDKEALNYHVLLIENMSHYMDEVDTHRNLVLEEWAERASQDLFTHLTQYTDAVIRRPLGKWLDFVESTEAMMKTTESYQNIANRPSHSRSAAKKVLKSYDATEIRKGVDTLKKRIEKHFNEVDDPMSTNKSLVARVYDECGARYAHAYDRMKLIIDKIYDGSLEIDWRKEDIAAMFKR